ncbi:MAG: Clp protease N-terminal domain-containing protein [Thermomicrobiales bacterium]
MPSSTDRKRLEVPTYLHDRLVEIAIDEDRTVASVAQEVIAAGLQHYAPAINPNRDLLRFTPRARAALDFAREETVPFNHNYIGTEHLLLGLLRVEEGVAARVLNKLDVDLEKCRALLLHICGRGSGAVPPPEELPYLPRARKALQFATAEADSYNNAYVGTEHLLLALVRVNDGMAAQMLSTFGVLNAIQTETLRVMVGFDPTQLAASD